MKSLKLLLSAILLLTATSITLAGYLYRIDLLVFTHATPEAIHSENWSPYPKLPNYLQASVLSANTPASYALKPYANILNRQANYHVILSKTWQQTITGRKRRIRITSHGQGLDGVLTLNQTNYINMDFNLLYQNGVSAYPIQLDTQRRMRPRELHYVDNPVLGVLVQATPIG
ncbi:MAG: hypothetical protein Tsb005_08710 [Gammaproteobacteria bacterium]